MRLVLEDPSNLNFKERYKHVISIKWLGFTKLVHKYDHYCHSCWKEIPPGKFGRKCKECRDEV